MTLVAASDIASEVLDTAREYLNGTIDVYWPGAPGTYDPVADARTGSTADNVVISARPARAQLYRAPLMKNDGNGASVRTRIKFQIEILAGDPIVQKGMRVRYSGGNDPQMNSFVYEVESAIVSSWNLMRTIMCSSEVETAN